MSTARTTPRAAARALVIAAALAGCRGGCAEKVTPVPSGVMGLLPGETRMVVSLDVAKVRQSEVWQRVAELVVESPDDRRALAEFTGRTGFDPLRHLRRVTAAFPDDARARGEFVVVIEGEALDERRLVAWAREQAEAKGTKIQTRTRGDRTLHVGAGEAPLAAAFLGRNRFVLGAPSWVEAVVDLADGKTGAATGELARLADRVGRDRALWFAAVVPFDVRKSLLAQPQPDSAASVTRLGGSAELGPGLAGTFVADLSNAGDAAALVQRIQTSVRQAKSNAQILMLGLGPYLETIEAKADGPTVRATMTLTRPQVDDLLGRVAGLLRMARGGAPTK